MLPKWGANDRFAQLPLAVRNDSIEAFRTRSETSGDSLIGGQPISHLF